MMRTYALATTLFTSAVTAYRCINLTVPLNITAPSETPAFAPFESSLDSVQFLNNVTTWAYAAQSPFAGSRNISISVNIAAQYCYPSDGCSPGDEGQHVQVLTHDIGFDSSYWEFEGADSEYNYIKAATTASFSTLSYDRLGTGHSTTTDPYTTQQLGPETAVLVALTSLLRRGTLHSSIHAPSHVVHIGHSFGSVITSNLAEHYQSLTDGIVLTGYSTNSSFATGFAISSKFEVAAESLSGNWYNRSKGFLTWPEKRANQYSFLAWPYFSPDVLELAEASKQPFAVSEFLTAVPMLAPNYDGPIISGAYDRIFCGNYCYGILEAGKSFYPKARTFRAYVQPNTGHGMNLHYNATGFYAVIADFKTNT
ncbi:hypothetical protein M409DRAFT_21432 [Zasmidium cellare ATCC 36951]|uniref:AB hydrolase-1 domain-containing protein n=1 Tax=Zasmidium cellare ATCC 36951 TaxID=1080233 RepID=A0A6A6CNS0_ZASCE|nr:uncharacterized protein M409DRAFT_21432 [Zasmidium cellare ATCC 36951]KAF2168691.1 hypothetical protein M409DRAFT_21432 [Zasmidium cellare ATCC 36951]